MVSASSLQCESGHFFLHGWGSAPLQKDLGMDFVSFAGEWPHMCSMDKSYGLGLVMLRERFQLPGHDPM